MGNSRLSSADWISHSTSRSYASASHASTLTASTIDSKMLPKNFEVREARDSVMNPNSLPIILALDCTGSMSSVILACIKKFGMIIDELVTKKAVDDPAIMTMFFDDVYAVGDRAIQATQFESDLEAVKQLEKLNITGAGGGNDSESYHLPLYIAAFKTAIDSFEKRGKRGYLFTVGDEYTPPELTKSQIQSIFGNDESTGGKSSFTYEELYDAASLKYDVFHVVIMKGSHASSVGKDKMMKNWKYLGQNLIIVDDVDSLPEIIVSTIRLREGHDRDDVISAWSGTTAVAVKNATQTVVAAAKGKTPDDSVVTL